MLPFYADQTVRRIRPGTKQVRGCEVPDWDNADELDIPGCSVQPASTSATIEMRVSAEADMTAYMPPDADIDMGDRAVCGGVTYAVMGKPQLWHGMGGPSHVIVPLKEWEG